MPEKNKEKERIYESRVPQLPFYMGEKASLLRKPFKNNRKNGPSDYVANFIFVSFFKRIII